MILKSPFRIVSIGILSILIFCGAPSPSFALKSSQQDQLFTEMHRLVKRQQDVLSNQKEKIEEQQKKEIRDLESLEMKTKRKLALAEYQIKLHTISPKSGVSAEALESKRAALEKQQQDLTDKKAKLTAAYTQELKEIEQKIDQQTLDLESAQNRFKSAVLMDTSNDRDYVLGNALGAFSDPNWTPTQKTNVRCKMVEKATENPTSVTVTFLSCKSK